MERKYFTRLILIVVLLIAIELPGLIQAWTEKSHKTDVPESAVVIQNPDAKVTANVPMSENTVHDMEMLMIVVINPPVGGDTSYLYSIDRSGNLSSALGKIRPGEIRPMNPEDFWKSKTYEKITLDDVKVDHLVALADKAISAYESNKDIVVRDSYEITLFYQNERYHGYYFEPEFSDLTALCDALIGLSPMLFEEKGFA